MLQRQRNTLRWRWCRPSFLYSPTPLAVNLQVANPGLDTARSYYELVYFPVELGEFVRDPVECLGDLSGVRIVHFETLLCRKNRPFGAICNRYLVPKMFDTDPALCYLPYVKYFLHEGTTPMASLSYREKSLYATLLVELAVYLPYFVLHGHNSVNKVAGMIAAIIVLQIILQSVIAAVSRSRLTDERDRLIELRGYRAGYFTFASLMALGLAALWFHSSVIHNLNVEHHNMGLHFISVFFGMLVIADITKTIVQLIAYRRSL